MTIEANPVGIKCNLKCGYCYETEMRDAGNYGPKDYDLELLKAGILSELGTRTSWVRSDCNKCKPDNPCRQHKPSWTLHGGEPFLMDIEDIESIWDWGYSLGHALGAQTNGVLVTDAHIALAKKYEVHMGFSIDGPGSMNDLRARGTEKETRAATAASLEAVRKCCAEKVSCSVIVVLHNLNMDRARRGEFKQWIKELDAMGVSGVRFHPMELDNKSHGHAPAIQDYIDFYRDMRTFMYQLKKLRIDIVNDIRSLLLADDEYTTCTWNGCDPYTTSAVQGVNGAGTRTNCGRTQKDGVAHPKADRPGFERYLALFNTPQEYGGCQGCRFFAMCVGNCPGEGIDGDWRNRSMYCGLYMALFEDEEQALLREGKEPVSLAADRVHIEQMLLAQWSKGNWFNIKRSREALKDPRRAAQMLQDVSGHADVPHGDSHGDHNDASLN